MKPPIGATCHYERDKDGGWWIVWGADFSGDEPGRVEADCPVTLEMGYQEGRASCKKDMGELFEEIEPWFQLQDKVYVQALKSKYLGGK